MWHSTRRSVHCISYPRALPCLPIVLALTAGCGGARDVSRSVGQRDDATGSSGVEEDADTSAEDAPIVTDAMAYLEELEHRLRVAEEIVIEVEVEGAPELAPRAVLMQAQANRLRWQANFVQNGRSGVATMDSDGTTARIHDDAMPGGDREVATQRDLRELLVQAIARANVVTAVGVTVAPDALAPDGDECCWVAITRADVGSAETIDGVRAVPIRARLARFGREYESTTLWIDPATRLPVRRDSYNTAADGTSTHIIEHYRRFDVRP